MSCALLPAATKLICETSTFQNVNSRHNLVVAEHFFNFKLQMFVPDVGSDVVRELCAVVEGSTYYCAALPLSVLIRQEFIEAFVKKGRVSMLSVGEKIDEGDVIAVTPSGHLIMHITKDSYESLGLEGKQSQFTTRRSSSKYVVDVDLKKDCFHPGKKNYERVKDCLEKRYLYQPLFLFWWTPHDPALSSLSLPAFFESLGHAFDEIKNAIDVSCSDVLHRQPVIDARQPEGSPDSVNHEEFFEWLGALACGLDTSCGSSGDFVTTLCCPEPNKAMAGMTLLTLTGFVPTDLVVAALKRVQEIGRRRACWSCIIVNGFADSPVSWGLREHMFNFDGDNLYTFVSWPNDNYWLYTAIGSQDVCP